MKDLRAFFEGFSFDVSFVSPTCLGINMNFYNRFAVSTGFVFAGIILPWIVAVLVAFVTLHRARSRHNKQGTRRRRGTAAATEVAPTFGQIWRRVQPTAVRYSLIVMLFAHPALSGQTFFFFSCHEIDGKM